MHCGELLITDDQTQKSIFFKTIGKYQSYTVENNRLLICGENGKIGIKAISKEIVKISLINDNFKNNNTGAVVLDSSEALEIIENKDKLIISIAALKIIVKKESLNFEFYRDNKLITKDSDAYRWNYDEVRFSQTLKDDDLIYGLGEKTGFLNKRGRKYEMWNSDVFNAHNTTIDPLYVSVPFFITFSPERCYGLYFDNSYRSKFDMDEANKNEYTISSEGGDLTYYLITGDNIKEIINNYTNLTGKTFMPPKWSLGHHQSRYSYKSEKEVFEVAENFKKHNIPCDVMYLDIHYMNEYRVFTWDENNYPYADRMNKKLKEEYGIKMITIVDPGVKADSNYDVYLEAMKEGHACKYPNGQEYIGKVWPGDTVFPDFTAEKTRKWWGEKTTEFMKKYSVDGIWHDMNEPGIFTETSTMDLEVVHDGEGEGGTHAKYHNLYGFYENKAVYESIKNDTKKRPFILTRAGFSGIQRYAAVWTGDNRSMWEHLELALPMLLNMGMSGISFCGTDVGGFSFNSSGELLSRWYQIGALSPFFRNHCENNAISQEAWSFGDKYKKIIKKYIDLRYSLMTEIYNAFYENHKNATPVMKPLVMEYSDDKNTYEIYDQFLFANSLMVAPILRPGVTKRMIYLPEGNWYDFESNKKYEGKNHIIYDAPIEKLPLFIKGGGILPINEVANNVESISKEKLSLMIINDENIKENSYKLYNDDGESYEFENGKYHLEEIRYSKSNRFIIEKEILNNDERYKFENIEFIIKNISTVNSIKIDGKSVEYSLSDSILKFIVKNKYKKIEIE